MDRSVDTEPDMLTPSRLASRSAFPGRSLTGRSAELGSLKRVEKGDSSMAIVCTASSCELGMRRCRDALSLTNIWLPADSARESRSSSHSTRTKHRNLPCLQRLAHGPSRSDRSITLQSLTSSSRASRRHDFNCAPSLQGRNGRCVSSASEAFTMKSRRY